MNITKHPIRLHASAKGVITHFLFLPGHNRIGNVIKRVENLTEEEVVSCMNKVMKQFAGRHRNIEETFINHFNRLNNQYQDDLLHFTPTRKLLLGAFFTKEYSIQAAALFNPSIVAHPDQDNLKPGEQRFVMSLRATGEGHISSIVFQTGVVDSAANIMLDEVSGYFTCLEKNEDAVYGKDFIRKRVAALRGFKTEILERLPETFTASEAINKIKIKEGELLQNNPLSWSI